MLGVPAELFDRIGAVSEQVARAMAEGGLAHADVDLAIAVTGIAGPGGATPTSRLASLISRWRSGVVRPVMPALFPGNRSAIRLAASMPPSAGVGGGALSGGAF